MYTLYKRFIFTLVLGTLIWLGVLVPALASAAARTLVSGMSGPDVSTIQIELSNKGYLTAAPSGYFGAATLAAVKKFQCEQKIVCSGASYGVAGPRTQAVLAAVSASTGGTITGNSLTKPFTGPLEFSGWLPDWRAA